MPIPLTAHASSAEVVTPALLMSVLALLFTVLSFWWMNWRRGRLHISSPRSYAALGSIEARLVLELPFVFFNDGPLPIIIQNLRLVFLHETAEQPLVFTATEERLGSHNEGRALATQFPVRGREALSLICEFQRNPGNLLFEERAYELELQGQLDEDKRWRGLCAFTLSVSGRSATHINTQFLVHDNASE